MWMAQFTVDFQWRKVTTMPIPGIPKYGGFDICCKYHFQASFWQLLKSLTGGTSTILWLPLVAAAVASQISARCRNNAAAKSHQVVSGTRKYPRWRAQWRAHGLGGLNHSSCSQRSSTAVIRSCDQLTCSESRNALATSCFLHVGCSKFLSVNSIVWGERSKIRIYRLGTALNIW